jgi:DNA-binding winged helix-turn-helix (wHTH) protein
MPQARRYRFGEFMLDLDTGPLQRDGAEPVALRRLALRVLTLLLQNAPHLVSRDQLLQEAWGRQAVSDSVVAQVIKELRQLLGDSARTPRYLETRSGQGYRIVMPVEVLEAAASPQPPAVSAPAPPTARRRLAAAAAALICLVLALLAWAPWRVSAGDPLLAADALRLDWRRLDDRALSGLPLADARIAAEALLARGEIAAVHALVAEQRPAAGDAWERGLLDLIELRAQGRDHEALSRIDALLLLTPEDLPLRLLRSELEVQWRAPSARSETPADPMLPAERRLLQDARAAGHGGDAEAQQQHARAAIELAGERSAVLRELARIELGLALARLGDSEGADAAFVAAQATLRSPGYHRLALGALLQRSTLARRTGRAANVLPALEAEDARLADSGDAAARAELTRHRGILIGIGGDHATALALLETAAEMFIELGDHARASSALNASSGPLGRLGRNAEVPARLAEAQRHAALSGHPESAAAIAGNLGLFHWRRGEIGAAVTGMREALAHFERADRPDDVAQARNNLATLVREAGDTAQALTLRELAIAHARRAGLRADLATRLYGLAEDQRSRGDPVAARTALDESEALYGAIRDAVSLQAIKCLRGLWALEADQLPQARALLPKDRANARPTADQAACDALGVRLAAVDGRTHEALAEVAARIGVLEGAGQRLLAQQARLWQAELLLAAGQPEDARTLLGQLRAASIQDGHVALERGVALTWLRLAARDGTSGTQAASATEDLLRRFPDQPAQTQLACLRARHALAGARVAQTECRAAAAAIGLAGIARWALEGP